MDYNKRKILNQKLRGHSLLSKKFRQQLPSLYATDGQGLDAIAKLKFFTPFGGWYWYAVEFDGQDLFYGLVFGPYVELGYFSLRELEVARDSKGLPVERDLSFQPLSLREIKRVHLEREGEIREYMI